MSKKRGGRQALAMMFDRKIQTNLVLLKFNVAMRVKGGGGSYAVLRLRGRVLK